MTGRRSKQKRTYRIPIAILAVAAALGVLAAQRVVSGIDKTIGTGGAGGVAEATPVQITPGEYRSSVSGRYAALGAENRGKQVEIKEHSEAPFAGWVNGIYIYPDESNAPVGFVPDPAARTGATCSSSRVVSENELKTSGYYMDIPSWMPPGAVEAQGIFASACGSQITVVSRQFELQPYGVLIGVILRPGVRNASFPAVAERVHATRVNGRPAVAITPLTTDGFGNSAIFILTAKGLLQVGGYGVRFADLRAIAESIK